MVTDFDVQVLVVWEDFLPLQEIFPSVPGDWLEPAEPGDRQQEVEVTPAQVLQVAAAQLLGGGETWGGAADNTLLPSHSANGKYSSPKCFLSKNLTKVSKFLKSTIEYGRILSVLFRPDSMTRPTSVTASSSGLLGPPLVWGRKSDRRLMMFFFQFLQVGHCEKIAMMK